MNRHSLLGIVLLAFFVIWQVKTAQAEKYKFTIPISIQGASSGLKFVKAFCSLYLNENQAGRAMVNQNSNTIIIPAGGNANAQTTLTVTTPRPAKSWECKLRGSSNASGPFSDLSTTGSGSLKALQGSALSHKGNLTAPNLTGNETRSLQR